jgi:mannonate dehydratase
MGSLEGWKRLLDIVPSTANGMTFDCGVTRELGEDPLEVCRYIGSRDRINHMHFRNVKTAVPRLKYTEVFLDEGEVDMFAVMKELVRQGYPRLIYPEHPPAIDGDREHPYAGIASGAYAGFAFTVGYARATLQAAVKSQTNAPEKSQAKPRK